MKAYEELLNSRLESIEAWVGIGICFRDQLWFSEAVAAFQKAAAINVEDAKSIHQSLSDAAQLGKRLQRSNSSECENNLEHVLKRKAVLAAKNLTCFERVIKQLFSIVQ